MFGKWLMRKILKILHPLIKWIGKQRLPYTKKKITGQHYLQIQNQLKPGMVFLSKNYGELSNLFIQSYWKHSAIYIGGGVVIEATGRGVHKTDVISFMLSKDEISLHRFGESYRMQKAVDFALNKLGRPYDYFFESGNSAYYCIELVVDAFCYYSDKEFITPDVIIDDPKSWPKVWGSNDD